MFHFDISEERHYQNFRNFNRDILGSVDHRLLHKWINDHIKELARLQKKKLNDNIIIVTFTQHKVKL